MTAIAAIPGARRLIAVSVVARLPLTMISIGLLLHAKHLTGSFAAAGVVDAAYAISLGLGGPLVGRAVDRRGQTAVLLATCVACAAMLAVIAALPVGTPLALLVVPACAIGCTMPPVGACLRALVPCLVPDQSAARAFYALDATAVELTWISGPALAVTLGTAVSTGFALAAAAAIALTGTAVFAAHPASRGRRPATAVSHAPSRPGRSPGLRTLILVMGALGVVFSAVQVGIAAATAELGAAAAAGPLLAVWGAGSLLGGLVATRLGGGARSAAGISLLLAALTAGHLSLALTATSVLGMAAVLLLAGATIAPTEASLYSLVDDVVPAGTLTESFSWLATAAAVGAALGAAAGGSLVASAGPVAAFAFAGAAGLVAVLSASLRGTTLQLAQPLCSP